MSNLGLSFSRVTQIMLSCFDPDRESVYSLRSTIERTYRGFIYPTYSVLSDPYQQFTLSYDKSVMIIFGRGKSRSLSHSSADHATNEKAKQEEVLEFVRSNAQRRRIHQSLGKPWRAVHILVDRRPPVESDWWVSNERQIAKISSGSKLSSERSMNPDEKTISQHCYTDELTTISEDSQSGYSESLCFRNCGLEAWEIQRAQWKKGKLCVNDAPLPPSNTNVIDCKGTISKSLANGLSNYTQTYNLPKPMNLKDIVNIYDQVWRYNG